MKPFLTFLFLLGIYSADSQITFWKSYGPGTSFGSTSGCQTKDSGYIFVGRAGTKMYMVRLNSTGDKVWSKRFDGVYDYLPTCVQETQDGGFIVAGTASSSTNYDIFQLKTDSLGDVLWSNKYGDTASGSVSSVRQTPDGGYITVGSIYAPNALPRRYLLKSGANGSLNWFKTFTIDSAATEGAIENTADGGFILLSNSSKGAGGIDMSLIKLDSSGNEQWSKLYGRSGYDFGRAVHATADGGYIIGGSTKDSAAGSPMQATLIKTDGAGSLIWSKVYKASSELTCTGVVITGNSGYVIAGDADVLTGIFALKVNAAGQITWGRSYNVDGFNEYLGSLESAYYEGFVMSVHLFSWGNWGSSFVKANSSGISGCNDNSLAVTVSSVLNTVTNHSFPTGSGIVQTPVVLTSDTVGALSTICSTLGVTEDLKPQVDFSIYPNPSLGKSTLSFAAQESGSWIIRILDLAGRTLQSSILEASTGTNYFQINAERFAPGSYLVALTNSSTKYQTLLIVE